jgi:anti-sigma B factor antagonist
MTITYSASPRRGNSTPPLTDRHHVSTTPRNSSIPTPTPVPASRRHAAEGAAGGDDQGVQRPLGMERLTVALEQHQGYLLMVLSGSAGLADSEEFEHSTKVAAENHPGAIIIDMTRLSFIASPAMGHLLGIARVVKSAHGRLALFGAHDDVKLALERCRMHQMIPVCDTLEDALRTLHG